MAKTSLFEDKNDVYNIENLKLKCKLLYLNYKDIKFSALAQLMCQNCGMYGRTYRCPPFSMKYNKTREYLKQFNKFVFIISESEQSEYERRYNEMKVKCNTLSEYRLQNLVGTQLAAVNLSQSTNDLKTVLRFIKARYDKYIAYNSAGCIKCKPCRKQLKQPCAHPYDSFSSPEGSGIDLYQTLRNKSIEIQSPPISRYVAICAVAWKE